MGIGLMEEVPRALRANVPINNKSAQLCTTKHCTGWSLPCYAVSACILLYVLCLAGSVPRADI
jgi:hypothetical protein